MFPKYVLLSICAFIRVYLGVRENFSIHPSGVYTFFFQKLVMISEFFFKEKLEVISFQKHVGFLARQLIIIIFFFFSFSFLEVFCYLNICIFLGGIFLYTCVSKVSCYLNIHIYVLWDIFAIYMHIQGILLPKHTYIYILRSIFVYIHAYLRYLST